MSTLILAMLMQYVIATKAGLVNNVQGMVNVKATQMAAVGLPIKTGTNGFVELLLTPGSFLRLGPNSEAVLEKAELDDVVVRVDVGSAVIEAVELNYPLHMKSGELAVDILDPGIYQFADGTVTIVSGKLRTSDSGIVYKKGWQVSYGVSYRAQKISENKLTALDSYSKTRSELLANANATVVKSGLLPQLQRAGMMTQADYWLYYPTLGASIYMPLRGYRSPYGYSFQGIGVNTYNGGNRLNGNEAASAANPSAPNANSNNGGNNNAGSSSGNNAGTSVPGDRMIRAPSGESMPRSEYLGRKDPGVPPPPQN